MLVFNRFIYCYRVRATGRPVYVGSAWNPAKRDRAHSNGDSIPFDRMIARHGRAAFTLETVEAVRGRTLTAAMRKAVPRENYWMDKLKTWHAHGGQNFGRAAVNFDSEMQYRAWRAANAAGRQKMYKDPKWRAANAAAHKTLAQDPKWRAANAAAHKTLAQDPKWRATMKRLAQDPKWRANNLSATQAANRAKADLQTPKMKRRLEKNALGLCGYKECKRKRWGGHVMCKKHTLYFRARANEQHARNRAICTDLKQPRQSTCLPL